MKISNKAAAAVTGLLGHSQCHHDSALDCQSHSFRRKAILFAGVEWPNSWHNCEIRLILTRSRKTECHQTIPLSLWLYGNLHFVSALWLMAWFIRRIIYATWQGINQSTVHIHGFSAAVLPHSKPNYIYVMGYMSSNALIMANILKICHEVWT